MAYQTGTTTGALVGISEGGGVGVAGGRSQSMLAKNLKPPTETSVGDSVAMIILLLVVFNLVGAVLMILLDPFIGIFVAIALTIGVAIFGFLKSNSGKDQRKQEFQRAMHQWAHSWICLRCGKSWLIN